MEHATIQTQQTSVEYPRISNGFQWFVCGTGFASNDERISIWKKDHMGVCMIRVRLKKAKMSEDVELYYSCLSDSFYYLTLVVLL